MKKIKQYRVYFEGFTHLYALSEDDVREYIKNAKYSLLENVDHYEVTKVEELKDSEENND